MGTAADADPPLEFRIAAVRLRPRRPLGGEQFARPTLPLPDRSGRPFGVVQRHGRAVDLLPAPPLDGSQQPFFFLVAPATPLLLHRAESTDLVVEGDQVLAEVLETVKVGVFLVLLEQRGGIGRVFWNGAVGMVAWGGELRMM